MPLVLSTATRTKTGIHYDDRTGESYEFPLMYRSRVVPGESFVYYRPGAKHYFGTGVIGEVAPSTSTPGRLMCDILDYMPFERTVPIIDETGAYYEVVSTRPNFRQGVRSIDALRLEKILAAGGSVATEVVRPAPGTSGDGAGPGSGSGGGFAAPDTRDAVDQYAMQIALAESARRYPGCEIAQMAHNNPGFDIRVGTADEPTRYVEVKGTQAGALVFFLSEGERRFSVAHEATYSLVVVNGIDLASGSHSGVTWRDGALDGIDVALKPTQWHAELL